MIRINALSHKTIKFLSEYYILICNAKKKIILLKKTCKYMILLDKNHTKKQACI
jgi:hypothetical protein